MASAEGRRLGGGGGGGKCRNSEYLICPLTLGPYLDKKTGGGGGKCSNSEYLICPLTLGPYLDKKNVVYVVVVFPVYFCRGFDISFGIKTAF